MRFLQVDVFAQRPYSGNQLAVFPEAGELTRDQMQAIASEMNLSESTFVTSASADSYDVRIFTPEVEMPFAGHPTIGTTWVLRHLGVVKSDECEQRSPAGPTSVRVDDDDIWFERTGTVQPDIDQTDPGIRLRLAKAMGLDAAEIGMEARELGRSGELRPAFAEAGIRFIFLPLRDLAALARISPDLAAIAALDGEGVYAFTAEGAGKVRARAIFPSLGIPEDPATGVAAAGLGLYLADRIGAIAFDVAQGVEMGRPSLIRVKSEPGRVSVGGRTYLIFSGELDRLP